MGELVMPRLGQIVLYKNNEGVVSPAMITNVHNETMVNLYVIGDTANERVLSVPFGQENFNWDVDRGDEAPEKPLEDEGEKINEQGSDDGENMEDNDSEEGLEEGAYKQADE